MNSSETFHDHVKELRNRLFVVLLSIGIFTVIGYLSRNSIVNFIHEPLSSPLYYNTPSGAFNLSMKISVVTGIFLSIPVILYNAVRFLEPALPTKLKRGHIGLTLIASSVLAIMGGLFGYYILLPLSLHFFGGYSSKTISPLLSANEYFNYVINLIIAFALLFQIPLLIDFANRIKPFRPKQLIKYQKHVIVGAIIIAIILPFTFDPITQFIVAVPIVALYYLSILIITISNRETRKQKTIRKYSNIAPIATKVSSYSPVFNNISTEPIIKPEPVKIEAIPVSIIIAKKPSKYFDVVPKSGPVESTNLTLSRPGIKKIQKTHFVDGFRPVVRGI